MMRNCWFKTKSVCGGVCVWVPLHLCLFASLYICAYLFVHSTVFALMCACGHIGMCACWCHPGVSPCLMLIGEFDLALLGSLQLGSEPAQLPQRNRGHLFSLHTGRSVLKSFSESSIHIWTPEVKGLIDMIFTTLWLKMLILIYSMFGFFRIFQYLYLPNSLWPEQKVSKAETSTVTGFMVNSNWGLGSSHIKNAPWIQTTE